jgi:hypothetical protein
LITHRFIQQTDIIRAAQVNDAIATEHGLGSEGAYRVGEELGVNIPGVISVGTHHAISRVQKNMTRREAREAVSLAFVMGCLAAMRAVEHIGLERMV